MTTATLMVIDRKNPAMKFKPTLTFQSLETLNKYVKDLRRMKYKTNILARTFEEWEILATENIENYTIKPRY